MKKAITCVVLFLCIGHYSFAQTPIENNHINPIYNSLPRKHKKKNKQNRVFNDYRYFDLGLTFMIPLNDKTDIFGFDLSAGYELKYPNFDYIGIKPNIGFNYLSYQNDRTILEIPSESNIVEPIPNPNRFTLNSYSFYTGASATFYLPFYSGGLESLFLANDFNWMVSRMKISFPEQSYRDDLSKTSNFHFFYNIKLGIRGIPFQSEKMRLSFWLGFTTLDLKYEASKVLTDMELSDMQPHLIFGFNLLF